MTLEIEKIYIDSSDRSIYDNFMKSMKVKGHTPNRDLFMFALSVGFGNNQRIELEKKQEYFWASDLGDESELLIKSIAIHNKKTPDILQNHEELIKIVQEYAHGGILFLKDKSDDYKFGSLYKHIEKEIDEKYKKCGIS